MKKECVIVFLLLVLLSNVIAYESTINVKTGLPNQDIIFKACDQITGKTLEGGEFRQKSDSEGKVVFNYNLEPLLIKMSFMAWSGSDYSSFLNGKQTIFLNNVILDDFVDVDLNKKEPSFKAYNDSEEDNAGVAAEVAVANETNTTLPNNTTTSSNITASGLVKEEAQTEEITQTAKNTSLTGAVISQGKDIFSSAKTYFILLGILVLAGGFILAKKRGFGSKRADSFIVTKLSEMRANKEEQSTELEAAERKLKEVQKELEDLKNKKGRIKEVQERLKKDREELKRLGGKE
jgi:hypothetical protein